MNLSIERDRLLALAEKATPGPWELWTSCSFRRFGSHEGMVCEPVTQNDGHPDLYFRNGGNDGPDARLIAAVPDMIALIRAQAAEIERLRGVCATTYQAAGVSDWPEPWLDILSDAANGAPLRHDPLDLLPFTAPGTEKDAERLLHVFREIDGYDGVDIHEQASINASFAGRDEPSDADYLAAIRSTVDAAIARRAGETG